MLWKPGNNGFHSTHHIQVAVWISYQKFRPFIRTATSDFVRTYIFGKIKDKFLRNRSWGRQDSTLLITAQGKLMNMNHFLLIKDVSEWNFHSCE
jgi:hypothetical protein